MLIAFFICVGLTERRLTMHNVHYLLSLMRAAREAIVVDEYPRFVRSYFERLYKRSSEYPQWAVTALRGVGVDLLEDDPTQL